MIFFEQVDTICITITHHLHEDKISWILNWLKIPVAVMKKLEKNFTVRLSMILFIGTQYSIFITNNEAGGQNIKEKERRANEMNVQVRDRDREKNDDDDEMEIEIIINIQIIIIIILVIIIIFCQMMMMMMIKENHFHSLGPSC